MNKLLQEAQRQLKQVLELARREGKKTGFCIGNTTKHSGSDYFFSPLRNTSRAVFGSVIVNKVSLAEELARFLDGKVALLAVDTEKKIPPDQYGPRDAGNIERAVRRNVRQSRILTFKGNDLTVDAIDTLLGYLFRQDERGLGAKKVAIVGAGNIGFKLALRLIEQGAGVTIVRRDKTKLDAIVQALNYVKPPETMAMLSGTVDALEAAQGAQVLIGLTPGTRTISKATIEALAPDAILVDGGKGSFSPEALRTAQKKGLAMYRADVRASFHARVESLFATEAIMDKGLGRRIIGGVPVVSGGLLARKDEVVVDNVHSPRQVHGVADGCGDFVRNLNAGQQRALRIVQEHIASVPHELVVTERIS